MDESSRNSVKIAQLDTVVSRRPICTVQFFMFMGEPAQLSNIPHQPNQKTFVSLTDDVCGSLYS